MTDQSDLFTEGAKVVTAVAEAGKAAIEAGSQLGKFFAKMFGTAG